MITANRGHKELVEMLLKRGVEGGRAKSNGLGNTALMAAALLGREQQGSELGCSVN